MRLSYHLREPLNLYRTEAEFVDSVDNELCSVSDSKGEKCALIFPALHKRFRFLIHKVTEYHPGCASFSIGEGWYRRTIVCSNEDFRGEIKSYITNTSIVDRANKRLKMDIGGKPTQITEDETAAVKEMKKHQNKERVRRPDMQVYVPRARRSENQKKTPAKNPKVPNRQKSKPDYVNGKVESSKASNNYGEAKQNSAHVLEFNAKLWHEKITSDTRKVNSGNVETSDVDTDYISDEQHSLKNTVNKKVESAKTSNDDSEANQYSATVPEFSADNWHKKVASDTREVNSLNIETSDVNIECISDKRQRLKNTKECIVSDLIIEKTYIAKTQKTSKRDTVESSPEEKCLISDKSVPPLEKNVCDYEKEIVLSNVASGQGISNVPKDIIPDVVEDSVTEQLQNIVKGNNDSPIVPTEAISDLSADCASLNSEENIDETIQIDNISEISLNRIESPQVRPSESLSVNDSFSDDISLEKQHDEDSWDALFDDSGDCLNPEQSKELDKKMRKVKLKTPAVDYLQFTPEGIDMSSEEFKHILELYDFPAELKTQDLIVAFSQFKDKGFDIKWVDDTHALAVFSNAAAASCALSIGHTLIKTRPLSEAIEKSKLKAKHCSEFLLPYKPRPETSAALARRLVTGALGLQSNVPNKKRDDERRKLKEAKEKKKQTAKQKQDIWDGKV